MKMEDTDMATDTIIINPQAAEKIAAQAEVSDLARQVDIYDRAAAALERQLAPIQAELADIVSERNTLRVRQERAEARVDIADYVQLSPIEERRRALLRAAEAAALASYRLAEQRAGSLGKEPIVREWDAALHKVQASERNIGLPRYLGGPLTRLEHEAVSFKLWVALDHRMRELTTA